MGRKIKKRRKKGRDRQGRAGGRTEARAKTERTEREERRGRGQRRKEMGRGREKWRRRERRRREEEKCNSTLTTVPGVSISLAQKSSSDEFPDKLGTSSNKAGAALARLTNVWHP